MYKKKLSLYVNKGNKRKKNYTFRGKQRDNVEKAMLHTHFQSKKPIEGLKSDGGGDCE
jgi:hypothetical protein